MRTVTALLVVALTSPASAQSADAGVVLSADAKPSAVQFAETIECDVPSNPPKRVPLSPGVYLPQAVYDAVDAELIRAQLSEEALKGQNENLGMSLSQRPGGLSLKGAAIILGIGFAAGAVVGFGIHSLVTK